MPALMRTRRVASTALQGAALVLVGAGRLAKLTADAVRPAGETDEGAADHPDAVTAEAIAEDRPGVVKTPPQEPVGAPDDPLTATRARTAESHAAAFAERPASEVIAEIDTLSTDDLRLLLEHEQAHRRRKSVLAAIEQAAAQHTS